jgi:hypothetical protein
MSSPTTISTATTAASSADDLPSLTHHHYESDSEDSTYSFCSDDDDFSIATDSELELDFSMDIDDDAFDLLNDPTTETIGQRKSYDMATKKSAIKLYDDFLSENPKATVKEAAKHAKIPYAYYVKRWRADVAKGEAISLSADPSMHVTGKTAKLHPGRKGSLSPYAATIHRAVFELREQGLPVTTRTIVREASKVDLAFKVKSDTAKMSVVKRLVKKLGLSQRVSTHVAQKNFKETELVAKAFMEVVRARVKHMLPDAVANMDQTPIPFCQAFSQTHRGMDC